MTKVQDKLLEGYTGSNDQTNMFPLEILELIS